MAVLPVEPARGGSEGRPNPGLFIRNFLASQQTGSHDIYVAYKSEVQSKGSPEYTASCKRKIRRILVKAKRTRPRERVKVLDDEIEALLPGYMSLHPPRARRHCCSYNSFMHYIYVLRELGLVEYTGQTQDAEGKGGSPGSEWHQTHPSIVLRIVPGQESSMAWSDLWRAYHDR